MLRRCANGRVYDLLLADVFMVNGSNSPLGSNEEATYPRAQMYLLDQVKDGDPVAHGGNQTGSIRREENISLAINRTKQIRKLK